jgi:acetyl esterase/lipase
VSVGQIAYDLAGIDPELHRAATLQPVVDYADPESVRATLRRSFKLSRALRPAPPGDVEVSDRSIPARPGAPEIPVRIYSPQRRQDRIPALLFFHGGAFVAGDLETEDLRCREYTHRLGILVLSVDYRLAPENRFPAAFQDCWDSLLWLHASAAELGVDPRRIAVGGSSAGGALAAAVALFARDEGGPPIALQLLLYPVIDNLMGTASMAACVATPGWNQPNSVQMWRHYLDGRSGADVSPYAAPARATDLRGLPRAYVMTADRDPLRDEGIAYATRLVSADVATEVHNFPGTFHGFDAAAPLAALSLRALGEQAAVIARAVGTGLISEAGG